MVNFFLAPKSHCALEVLTDKGHYFLQFFCLKFYYGFTEQEVLETILEGTRFLDDVFEVLTKIAYKRKCSRSELNVALVFVLADVDKISDELLHLIVHRQLGRHLNEFVGEIF